MKRTAPIYRLKRRAKRLARENDIPLHAALDRVARDEGFAAWSLLSASHETRAAPPKAILSSKAILSALADGDLLLLGARPRQGKTLLGMQLLLDAVEDGRRAVFFTLEYSAAEAEERFLALDGGNRAGRIEIVTSEAIGADYIQRRLAGAPRGTVAAIDYLQSLDQQRSKPPLAAQIATLRDFARKTGVVLAFIAQIDRGFDPNVKPLPDIRDLRLPNPLDLASFSKTCFLHGGAIRFG